MDSTRILRIAALFLAGFAAIALTAASSVPDSPIYTGAMLILAIVIWGGVVIFHRHSGRQGETHD